MTDKLTKTLDVSHLPDDQIAKMVDLARLDKEKFAFLCNDYGISEKALKENETLKYLLKRTIHILTNQTLGVSQFEIADSISKIVKEKGIEL